MRIGSGQPAHPPGHAASCGDPWRVRGEPERPLAPPIAHRLSLSISAAFAPPGCRTQANQRRRRTPSRCHTVPDRPRGQTDAHFSPAFDPKAAMREEQARTAGDPAAPPIAPKRYGVTPVFREKIMEQAAGKSFQHAEPHRQVSARERGRLAGIGDRLPAIASLTASTPPPHAYSSPSRRAYRGSSRERAAPVPRPSVARPPR